jgi:S-adenosylmethionine/arginine decarboxylase-like enzyme
MLDHKHLIIIAKVLNPPTSPTYIKKWTKKLIKDIDMNILLGPYAVYSDMVGNRGLTCIAAIDTSSINIHCWDEDEPGTIQADIYSCKDFDINIAFRALDEFVVTKIDYHYLDRNGDKITPVKKSWILRLLTKLRKMRK